MTRATCVLIVLVSLARSAVGASIPTEMETPTSLLDRLYSYFGGVGGFSVSESDVVVHSGRSMELTIGFQPSFFAVAGVGVGTLGVSAPDLAIAVDADTFSVSVSPPESGQLAFYVTVQEDDNGDGIIDIGNGDDEWESPVIMLELGTKAYNIPVSDFLNTGQGSGNGVQEFTTTGRMALILDIHSRATFPGGLITTPKTMHLDHMGFFVGPQTTPSGSCTGDANGDGVVEFNDIASVLSAWQSNYSPGTGPGDADGSGAVDFEDVTAVLSNWLASCS